jgi:hypothetical protein
MITSGSMLLTSAVEALLLVLYGPRLRKIRYTAATTTGVVMRNTARRNNAHSHQDSSTALSFSPRTAPVSEPLCYQPLGLSITSRAFCFALPKEGKRTLVAAQSGSRSGPGSYYGAPALFRGIGLTGSLWG